ncbi:MAG: hypothetical protein JOZ65_31015 [Chloroflexi bacterium]|nr:hypothetical protein [Chloroflexota bacterium]
MSALLDADYVPRMVVGLLATGWIDRLRRRPVLISANLVRAAALTLVEVVRPKVTQPLVTI